MINVLTFLDQKLADMRSRTPNPLHVIYCVYEIRVGDDQVFTLDLTGEGSASATAADGRAECVISIASECLEQVVNDPAQVGEFVRAGKIRTSSRLRAAQLLDALWPGALRSAVDERLLARPHGPSRAESTSTEEFFSKELPDRLRQNPRLFGFVHAEYQLDIAGAGTWTVDMTGHGQVRSEPAKHPKCIITVSRESFDKALADPRLVWPMLTEGQIQVTDTCRGAQFLSGLFPDALQQSMPPALYHSLFPNAALAPSAPEYNSGSPVMKTHVMGTVGLIEVEYEPVNGLAIYQGDIILGTVEEMERVADAVANEHAQTLSDFRTLGLRIIDNSYPTKYLWPNGVVIYDNTYNTDSIPQELRDAENDIQGHTSITFRERTEADPNWISIEKGTGCSSQVGMRGGKQLITLEKNCGTGAIIHEICHSLGLEHEQCRIDRDDYVTILWDNIIEDKKHNFFKKTTEESKDLGSYDYDSIMHYDAYAFAKDTNKKTIETTNPKGAPIGQRSGLSTGDCAALTSMYPKL